MNERSQRILWLLMGMIAVGLGAATVYLYRESRRLPTAKTGPPYRIAYVHFSEGSGRPQIYTCNFAGEDIRPLTGSETGDAFPVCEPVLLGSGKAPRIAFLRSESAPSSGRITTTEAGTPGAVYVVNSRGEVTKVSGQVPRIWAVAPSWSPDGKQLAFAGVEDLNQDGKFTEDEIGIYVSEVEKDQVQRIVTANVAGFRLAWSPAGSQLLLQVRKPDAPVPIAHLLDIEHKTWLFEGDPVAVITAACWSPDGQRIAAYSMTDNKIYIVRSDGSDEYALDAPTGYVVELLWTAKSTVDNADGQLWAVTASQPTAGSAGQLWTRPALPSRSEAWQRLTDDETDAAYLAASPDGHYLAYMLFSAHSPQSNVDLYVLELGQDKPRRLTSDPGFEGMATWVTIGGK